MGEIFILIYLLMSTIPSNYNFVRLQPSDLPTLKGLILNCFSKSLSLPELESKYSTLGLGSEVIGFLAFSADGETAAFYGVFPMLMQMGDQTVLVAQSGDTMTSPKHQKRGLFVDAARRTYQLAKKEGISFVFGFPNENSQPGFERKLDWSFFGFMYDFSIRTNGFPFVAIMKRLGSNLLTKGIRRLIAKRIERIAAPITEDVVKRLQSANHVAILRNPNYLAYKLKRGASFVKWDGYEFFIKLDGNLLIGDVLPFEASQLLNFIQAVSRLGRLLLCHKVVFSVNSAHWLYLGLLSNGLECERSLPVGLLSLDLVDFDFSKISFCRLDYDTF
jgi:hypothetical protein